MFRRFSNFDEMITPGLIRVLYYIGLVAVGLASFAIAIGAFVEGEYIAILAAILFFLFGILMVRVYCELIMVGFKILENLRDINRKMDERNRSDSHLDY